MKTKNAQPPVEVPLPEDAFFAGTRCVEIPKRKFAFKLEREGKSIQLKLTGKSYKVIITKPKRIQRSLGTINRTAAFEGAVATLRHLNRGGYCEFSNN